MGFGALVAVLLVTLWPAGATARAGEQTLVFRSGAITVDGYGVSQGEQLIPSPSVDGYVTSISGDVVDENGVSVPIQSVMLHHIVLAKLGTPDTTCSSFTGYDGTKSTFPTQRFYAEGEERTVMTMPPGYGYPNRGSDRWGLVFMLMNHKAQTRTVYVQLTVHYVTGEQLTPVTPYWLDVVNCRADPIFNVPGTGGLFSTYSRTADFVMPQSGTIVAAGGHLHGGGMSLKLTDESCSGEALFTSEPTWGLPVIHPIIHEPGPKHMTTLTTTQGIPLSAGDRLRLTATYEDSLPHTRVMGIMLIFVAPATTPVPRCGPLPTLPADPLSHPGLPPRFRLPLAKQPTGPFHKVLGTDVSDFSYGAQRVEVKLGSRFTWTFAGPSRHDVTLANGPVGFSSQSLSSGSFSFRFTKPGVYHLYCSLHPTVMTETVVVH
jgi:plastocyanin